MPSEEQVRRSVPPPGAPGEGNGGIGRRTGGGLSDRHLKPPKRFYSLDAFRGVAALSIVFWHWQHFFFRGGVPGPGARPWHGFFLLFYGYGQLAVELFFALSGFIFFWLYAQQIADRAVLARDFFLRRFSRLVPLHLVTLFAVVLGQLAYRHMFGTDFVYPNNDLRHFVPNLFLVSAWGLGYSHSFNGPIWSVSVEIALYLLFFLLCRTLPIRAAVLAAVSVLGLFLLAQWEMPIGRGMIAFFLGGCVHRAYAWSLKTRAAESLARILPWVTAALWAGTLLAVYTPSFHLDSWPWAKAHPLVATIGPAVLLFPVTILTLALAETYRGAFWKRTSYLGDLSYSLYLIHFPLQLTFVLVVGWLSIDRTFFSSPVALVLFFVVLLPLSWVSYRFLEVPAQRWLRGRC
ncbi:MAG TPA: acyltransferase [Thermoanaerobaculia bacterium]|jgi:peptidoglycan/LPS O-acetylase OafA/YrhL|nr:acyltransferase [Thermoanaerobaculia bacterium]